ncbi:MAG: M23 family metallopeptidase, partial [Bacteroidia bacterium]|nr:M23 family metallopeptidase [Bacteroidia bacterium]
MRLLALLSLTLVCKLSLFAQKKPFPNGDFSPPFAGNIEIIGTFCELRPNHFHGGLDIRTGGQIGRPVLAIGDGYVSRINISNAGYGKALYISHPNGYTSVYAHLNEFPPFIQWYIEKSQYLLKKYEVELYPDADLLAVSKGQLIAYSGNTGASQGPHLHFEIRETESEAPVNPLLCGIKMNDHLPPSILNLYIFRQDSLLKLHNGHYPYQTLPLYSTSYVKTGKKKRKVTSKITHHSLAFGTYALA